MECKAAIWYGVFMLLSNSCAGFLCSDMCTLVFCSETVMLSLFLSVYNVISGYQYCVSSCVVLWFTVGGVRKKAPGPTGDEPENKRPK